MRSNSIFQRTTLIHYDGFEKGRKFYVRYDQKIMSLTFIYMSFNDHNYLAFDLDHEDGTQMAVKNHVFFNYTPYFYSKFD